jgi:hypothetical protein
LDGRYSGRWLDYDSTSRGENVGEDLGAYLSWQIIEKLGRHVDVVVFGKKMRSLFLGVEKLQATLRGSETVISYSNLRDMSMKNAGLPKNYPFNTQLPNNMVCFGGIIFVERESSTEEVFPSALPFQFITHSDIARRPTSLSFGFETLRSYPGKKTTNELSRFRRRAAATKLHRRRLRETQNLPSGGALLCPGNSLTPSDTSQ